jgi:hypothetical protein
MLLGRSIVTWVILAIVAVVVFLIAQWLLPLLFGVVDVTVPSRVVNGLSLLLALGVIVYGWSRPVAG